MPAQKRRADPPAAAESPRSSKRSRKSEAAEAQPQTPTRRSKRTTKATPDTNGIKKAPIAKSPAKEAKPKAPAKSPAKSPAKPAKTKKPEPVKKEDTPEEELKKSEKDTGAPTDPKTKPKEKKGNKERVFKAKDGDMPLASRTQGLKMFIGAHVSAAGGVQNSVTNASHIGANAFALFLKSQRKWVSPPLTTESTDGFTSACATHSYAAGRHVLPHGSYLVNLAQPEPEKRAQAEANFLDDLRRCDALGIRLYNFHPGNTLGEPRAAALARIADAVNAAHKQTQSVVCVLENMAGAGNTVGSDFADLRGIIERVADKARVGVCLDTCHAFAAGYDLRTPDAFAATLDAFDREVGMGYLRALHLNDSKAPLGARRDLHQNIGVGFLGLRAFHNVVNEPRFEGLPMVLETPIDRPDPEREGKTFEDREVWAKEIKLLESLIGMDAEGEEFKKLEKELADSGKEERKKYQDQADKKGAKEAKGGKRQKKLTEM